MQESTRNGILKSQLPLDCMRNFEIYQSVCRLSCYRYMLSAAVSSLSNRCDILTLRALNVFGVFGIFFTAFGCQQRQKRQNISAAELLVTKDDDSPYLRRAYDVHTALNIALFPPLFFFSALYYTDVLSTLYVIMSYDIFLRMRNPQYVGWQTSTEVLLSGLLALSCRQTNIFWVAVFPAGLIVVQVLKEIGQNPSAISMDRPPTFIECAKAAWKSGYVHDGPVPSDPQFSGSHIHSLDEKVDT